MAISEMVRMHQLFVVDLLWKSPRAPVDELTREDYVVIQGLQQRQGQQQQRRGGQGRTQRVGQAYGPSIVLQ